MLRNKRKQTTCPHVGEWLCGVLGNQAVWRTPQLPAGVLQLLKVVKVAALQVLLQGLGRAYDSKLPCHIMPVLQVLEFVTAAMLQVRL